MHGYTMKNIGQKKASNRAAWQAKTGQIRLEDPFRERVGEVDLIIASALLIQARGYPLRHPHQDRREVERQELGQDVLLECVHCAPGEVLHLGPALFLFVPLLDTPLQKPL